MASCNTTHGPILHLLVVGFHHKKGCQVEYAYPPLIDGNSVDSNELPAKWKNLPSLALPDGSHNFEKDTVFFHLPSLDEHSRTIYGISCYRQIDAKELVNKGSEVTRNTVQKSVCVISKLPLYGLIQAKLELITHAYFDEKDFSKVSLLEDTYTNLNSSLSQTQLLDSQAFLGLSTNNLVELFKHKTLVLFKLILLERKVLFYGSPASSISSTLLSALSLFPEMIERGLSECTTYSRQVSPTLQLTKLGGSEDGDEYLEVQYSSDNKENHTESATIVRKKTVESKDAVNSQISGSPAREPDTLGSGPASPGLKDKKLKNKVNMENKLELEGKSPKSGSPFSSQNSSSGSAKMSAIERRISMEEKLTEQEEMLLDNDETLQFQEDKLLLAIDNELSSTGSDKLATNDEQGDAKDHGEAKDQKSSVHEEGAKEVLELAGAAAESIGNHAVNIRNRLSSAFQYFTEKPDGEDGEGDVVHTATSLPPESPPMFDTNEFGQPLSVFSKGMLCHPYLCLQYYDLLEDVNIRGFVISASNILFKQKKQLIDVIVEVNEGTIDIRDQELRRQLTLSTADLRFADNLVKCAVEHKGEIYLDDTGWEGGDEWLRSEFKNYLLSLLACSKQNDEKLLEDFHPAFVTAWRSTHNYKVWQSGGYALPEDACAFHPCKGQLGVNDMKIKFSHTMQSSEKGKKINYAVVQTGKVVGQTVGQTGKVIGGALTSARSAMSSWFGGFSKEAHATDEDKSGLDASNEQPDEAIDANEFDAQESPDNLK